MAEKGTKELSRQEPQQQWSMAPFQEMERMERMLSDFFRRPYSLFSPTQWMRSFPEMEDVSRVSVDVFDEGDNVVVKAEVPGISKEDIEVSFSDNNTIMISGEKKKEEKVENKDYYRMERSYGSFHRSIVLPAEVNPDQASATFKDGILDIHIPKSEKSRQKVKKINIQ